MTRKRTTGGTRKTANEDSGKSAAQEYNEAKTYQAQIMGQGVSETLQRLDGMEVDEYIEAVRAYFIDRETIENFMRILTTCKDPEASTIVVRGKKYRVEPRNSTVFKKTFAEFLVREPKLMLSQYMNDPISLMAYVNATRRVQRMRKASSIMDVFG